jgi:hypothetical protein
VYWLEVFKKVKNGIPSAVLFCTLKVGENIVVKLVIVAQK